MTTRTEWRGVTVDLRTSQMLSEVAKLTPQSLYVHPTQGSFTTSTSASANTHAGGGAVDIRTRDLTVSERNALVVAMRRVGFAAWLRTTRQGFSADHCHAVAVQPGGKNDKGVLSTAAHNQVVDYYENRNGLANDGPDDATRAFVGVTWEKYRSPTATPAFPGTITPGARGSTVRTWQDQMIAHHYLADNSANRDGYYGPGMQGKAREMQRALHVPVDAILGRVTWDALT